jgi:hypothetical protein
LFIKQEIDSQTSVAKMEKRQIKMQDGRYLIFYTFPETPAPSATDEKENQAGSTAERSNDGNYEHYHSHIEFYPPLRTATKLKYLAGSETGAGMFINDTLAEEKAAELRERVEQVVWNDEKGRAGD